MAIKVSCSICSRDMAGVRLDARTGKLRFHEGHGVAELPGRKDSDGDVFVMCSRKCQVELSKRHPEGLIWRICK